MAQATPQKNERSRPKKPLKQLTLKKKLLLGVLCLFVLLVIAVAVNVLRLVSENDGYYRAKYDKKDPVDIFSHVDYTYVNYDEDVYEDEGWLALNRDILYIYGAQSSEVSLEEDGAAYGEGLLFFQTYFNAVVAGDNDVYRTLFWDTYFEEEVNFAYPPKPFAPQKLYNISVEYLRAEDVIVSETESKSYYVVKYMIRHNNDTFRPDLDDNSTIPLLFELTTKGDAVRISKIVSLSD